MLYTRSKNKMMTIFKSFHELLGGAKEPKDLEKYRKKFGLTTRASLYIDNLYRKGPQKNTALAMAYQTYMKPGFELPKSARLQGVAASLMKKIEDAAADKYRGTDKELVFGKDAAIIEDMIYDAWTQIRKVDISIKTRSDLQRVLDQVYFVMQKKDELCLCYAVNNILMLSRKSRTMEPVRVSKFFSMCIRLGRGCRPTGYFTTEVAEKILNQLGYSVSILPSAPSAEFLKALIFRVSVGMICIINPDAPHYVAIIPIGDTQDVYVDIPDVLHYFLYMDSNSGVAQVYSLYPLIGKLLEERVSYTLRIS